ncbi:MAG TPA: glycosyltransferase family 2 protein [Methylomirabilota bacterium]|nr:glycosyltransferase family 2 protein [Methylomirabilota bacterium]
MRPWIVVPVFNEAATIGSVVAEAACHAPVIVVDDGSTDAGAAVARAAGADVLRHPRRLGKGQALRTGFAAARRRGASHVVTLDGDGQHAPADVPRLLAAARETPASIVVGGRITGHPGGTDVTLPGTHLNAIRVAGFFVNWASGVRVNDTQSGFRVYPVAVLDELELRRGGFVFETEVLVVAARCGVALQEVPITVVPRAARRSRFRPVADGAAITAYLSGPVLGRWLTEAGAGVAEIATVFDGTRRRERHGMLQVAAAFTDSPLAMGAALGAGVFGRAWARVRGWWRHERRRRAGTAAVATLAAPVLLVLAAARALAGRVVPDVVTPLVRRLYDQARLEPRAAAANSAGPVAGGADQVSAVAAGEAR